MRSIIIEDQAPAQQILQRFISNTALLKLEKTFCDAIEAKAYLADHPVDLIFLDIHLPRLSGMDFLRTVQDCPYVILTTAHAEFALESYQFKVVDYLLKPFSFERFTQAIDKVAAMALPGTPTETGEKDVYIKSGHGLVKINRDDIIYIKSDNSYTEVFTAANKHLTSGSLRDWMTKLGEDFKQVHKSYVINSGHLKKISHNKVFMANQVIPIGRAYKKDFMESVAKLTGP
ncbi:response regulator transcription factor [Chitinophaga horti]|uniref:Response regulator transcription factor n=1 Tax=Chitinophaga horti TaxID=2920382 RepID=A0ABY6J7E7_9BACT|nr:response regulator transcription factor [Chitinophaga horti]UYQ95613.1 response regulator transcription factor [Chitinophaga horti]